MKDWDPKSLWDELRRAFHGWMEDDDDGEKARDPALMFHLLFTAPLLIGFLVVTRH